MVWVVCVRHGHGVGGVCEVGSWCGWCVCEVWSWCGWCG